MKKEITSQGTTSAPVSIRLHYLDWLRVIAILMVFLFHAVHVFDQGGWHIKNAEQSEILTIAIILIGLWGMPFFFMVAGSASWFALQRRTPRQYAVERVKRLLIPYLVGTLLFSPLQYYLWWMNTVQVRGQTWTFQEFLAFELPRFNPLLLRAPGFSPIWMGVGMHLWFVGFLFAFAMVTLPLFRWLKGEAGQRLIGRAARLCARRGGVFIFVVPLVLLQVCIRPFAPLEHDWADFLYQMAFFILGFILYAHKGITQAVRRDGWLIFGVGTAIVAVLLGMYLADLPVIEWGEDPSVLQYYGIQALVGFVALSYTLTLLSFGMRFLDFTNRWLRYAQENVLPFFVVHQPVIVGIAYFVVQWDLGILPKLLIVVAASFAVAIGLTELIRRVGVLRFMFGLKTGQPARLKAATDSR
ncbi:MAG TPA: acyltransferase family protein [Anaerolineae bacterium]|nr:acyltransferase family protein [Anaerolineae bacterium]